MKCFFRVLGWRNIAFGRTAKNVCVGAALGLLSLFWSHPGQAADTEQRGATVQKSPRRQAPKTGPSGDTPLFSPIPKGGSFSITNPIIMITPATLDFGYVAPGRTATNTFLLENVGHGKLSGTASVPAPFKIASGGTYTLKEKEIQVVSVVYSPTEAPVDTAPVAFTAGATTLKAKAIGRRLPPKE